MITLKTAGLRCLLPSRTSQSSDPNLHTHILCVWVDELGPEGQTIRYNDAGTKPLETLMDLFTKRKGPIGALDFVDYLEQLTVARQEGLEGTVHIRVFHGALDVLIEFGVYVEVAAAHRLADYDVGCLYILREHLLRS